MTTRQPPCDNAGLLSRPVMSNPSEPLTLTEAQHWVRPGVSADAPTIDAWLMARAPLAVPDARARRLSLQALLAQGGHGICLIGGTSDGTNDGQGNFVCLLPVALVHSLSTGGRIALAAEWWPPAASVGGTADAWRDACCEVLADWCRAHGIRYIGLAPGLIADPMRAPTGFQRDTSGFWLRSLVPTPKRLG